MRIIILMLLFGALTLTSVTVFAGDLKGKIIGITDGDTLTLITKDSVQYKIRLAEIDTPEKGQPYGRKAKEALSKIVFSKQSRIERVDIDRYGRIVGKVFVKGEGGKEIDVNRLMVSNGAAWVYRDYLRDKTLLDVEAEARANKMGLWALPEAEIIPPWKWRKRSQKALNKDISDNKNKSAVGFTCGSKRYCKQMSSCKEAYFYLAECGLNRLDGDKDGVPCESLCR